MGEDEKSPGGDWERRRTRTNHDSKENQEKKRNGAHRNGEKNRKTLKGRVLLRPLRMKNSSRLSVLR